VRSIWVTCIEEVSTVKPACGARLNGSTIGITGGSGFSNEREHSYAFR